MIERIYPRAGFVNWMIAAAVCALVLLPLGLVLTVIDPEYLNYDKYFTFAFPICSILSALMNWGYERRYNEEIYTRWYTHPNSWYERSICVLGGALMIVLLPFVLVLVQGLLFWLAFL